MNPPTGPGVSRGDRVGLPHVVRGGAAVVLDGIGPASATPAGGRTMNEEPAVRIERDGPVCTVILNAARGP